MNIAHVRKELRKRPKPLRWLISRVLLRSRLCSLLMIEAHGFVIRFHPSELSSDLWYNPKCRKEDVNFLKAYLKPGDSFVDVGANIGIWTLAAAQTVGRTGRVIAFEPHPRIFKFLRANVNLNQLKNVRLHNCAVGERAGMASFTDVKTDDTNRVMHSDHGLAVEIVTLQEVLERDGKIALLKVDAEGYEKYILHGSESIIDRVQCVFIEISAPDLQNFGCSSDDILGWLSRHGFSLYRVVAETVLEKITAATGASATSNENIIALRSEAEFGRRTGWTFLP